LSWWKTQEHSLPSWCAVVKKIILLVKPSSAAVEHVFSLLNSGFGDQKVQDYIEASVMLR